MSASVYCNNQSTNSLAGFSFVETAVVLVIIGLVTSMMVTTGSMQISITKYQATQATLANAKAAIDLYYNKYRRYPCPALPADAPTSATYGVEVAGGCAAACPAGLTCPAASRAVIGVLPYKTLNLGEEYAADDWENKINYIIDKDFTVANTIATYGTLVVQDKNGNEITKAPDSGKAIYALFSTGITGNGAWSRSGGSRATCDTTRKDGENCSNTAIITDTSINTGDQAGANSFDDIVLWKPCESTDHIVIPPP